MVEKAAAKLTTDEKLAVVEPLATPLFKAGDAINAICENLIIGGITAQGIAFTEVSPLVKQVGKAGGYIKTTEQKREEVREYLKSDTDLTDIKTWSDLEEVITYCVDTFDLPEKWCKDCIVATMGNLEIPVPKKSTLTDWQKATVDAFKDNQYLTRDELDKIIQAAGVQNFAHYGNLVHGLCYAIRNMDEVSEVEVADEVETDTAE